MFRRRKGVLQRQHLLLFFLKERKKHTTLQFLQINFHNFRMCVEILSEQKNKQKQNKTVKVPKLAQRVLMLHILAEK